MSIVVHQEGSPTLDVPPNSSQIGPDLSDVEDGDDSSSSLSELGEPDAEQEEGTFSYETGDNGDAEDIEDVEDNASEASTERLEDSPRKARQTQDLILNANSHLIERSPSKLKHHITMEDLQAEEEEGLNSEDENDDAIVSENESVGSSDHDEREREEPVTTATTLEDSSSEGKKSASINDLDSKKRKRSIMAGSGLDFEEPVRKRTGSVMTPGDDYAIEDEEPHDDEVDTSNPISGNDSADEGANAQDNVGEAAAEELPERIELPPSPKSPKKRGRRKKKGVQNGIHAHGDYTDSAVQADALANGENDAKQGDEDIVENDVDDEAEAALRNEEELEKKRTALDQLGAIEKQFATFRDRLYEERLEQLNREEAMLRQDKPTHPHFLTMMQCIDARRDLRIRNSENLRKYELQTLRNYAVARRSQILVQYHQDVREIREKKLEQLGKQWYEIQHDRRIYAGSVPDYTLKFPTKRNQQLVQQIAYNNEVSLLSGIAKYVGFPAAPPMAPTTDAELADDLEKMGRPKHPLIALQRQSFPLQELAGLRTSSTSLKPAEEQFIEQTPWANPQHPSHAHLLQRQTSAQQTPRTISPFSHTQVQPRRHSTQHGGPVSGTFSTNNSSQLQHSVGGPATGGRISPHNPFTSAHSHTIAPSPLGSRQPSLSPQQSHGLPPGSVDSHQATLMDIAAASHRSPELSRNTGPELPREFPRDDLKRETIATMTRF
ncbi:hypothetical protein BP5796_11823 [Coleophoma crateriformis]|uniref:Transcriptional regulatory protein DEP1 n=1 Tax=Coleophoma crateriformis TaxID=565419 RepID=A0A3D8QEQ8_9HELO|nr:hypothetical protein BP5796_11823 [Coleophoma crateriformis]